jgi:thiosulfate/3-mercaptopyruvate sulfurtransferase
VTRGGTLVRGALLALAAAGCRAPGGGAGAAVAPRPARPDMVVSQQWLARHLQDRDLVVLHVGTRAQYDSGHVAGARLVTMPDISLPAAPGGLTLQLPSADSVGAWARRLGITDRSRVVVVAHDQALQGATRVVFTLATIGLLDRTALLEGHYGSWRAAGHPVGTAAPAPAVPGALTVRPRPELVATLAQVEALAMSPTYPTGTALLDARAPQFYAGNGGGYPRPGHIPTAKNLPFSTLHTNGVLKPAAELRTLFAGAGAGTGTPIVAYCHIGQQASLLWFTATYLGLDARVFDGSFQEWSGTARLPVILPSAPKPPGL